jgi:hypothetical protein
MKRRFTAIVVGVAALALLLGPRRANAAVFDNFSDGNDTANPAWSHLSGYLNSTGQAWDASSGAYRLTAPNNGVQNYGFIGAYVQESTSDTVMADVVSFIDDPSAQGGVFGVAARLSGADGTGQLTGYAYVYEPFAAQGRGEMVLYKINQGIDVTDIGSQQVTLDPEKDYRFILEIVGDQLHGQVWEIGGGMVGERFATDATYPSGGFPGFIAYSQAPVPPVDVTFDNFSDTIPEPTAALLISLASALVFLRRR